MRRIRNVGVALYCSILLVGISSIAIAQQMDPPKDEPESVDEPPPEEEEPPEEEIDEILPEDEIIPENEIPTIATVMPSMVGTNSSALVDSAESVPAWEESPALDETPPVIETPPLDENLPVIEITPVDETSPLDEPPSIIEAPPVDVDPPVIEPPSANEIPPVIEPPFVDSNPPAVNEIPPVATVKPSVLGTESSDFDDEFDPFATANPTISGTPYWEHPSYERTPSEDEDGEACRLRLINEWLNGFSGDEFNSMDIISPDLAYFDVTTLRAIQLTTLYQTIVEDCRFFLNEYNAAAGHTCNQQQMHWDYRFSEFWDVGPINMDGGWLLAADLFLTNNFQDSKPLIPCSDSCYIRYPHGSAERDCQRYGSDLRESYFDITKLTSVSNQDAFWGVTELKRSQRVLCDLGWLNTDRAYQNLRMCASESKVARTMAYERDNSRSNGVSERTKTASLVANAYASQRQKQAECAESAIEYVCPELTEENSAGSYDSSYDEMYDDDYIPIANAPAMRTSGALMYAVIGIVILVFLCIIAYCFMKRKKQTDIEGQ